MSKKEKRQERSNPKHRVNQIEMESSNKDANWKLSAAIMWVLICVGVSLLPLFLSIGIIAIGDFGWQNVEWNKIVPDYILIIFTISINVLGISINAKNKKYIEIAHLFGIVAVILACFCSGLYYGLFSPKAESGNYSMETLKVLLVISTIMLVVNSVFGIKIIKWENIEDEETQAK